MKRRLSAFAGIRRARRQPSRRHRAVRIEQLESRRVLATAIWNNLGQALNVDGDPGGVVSPIDALIVINELNQRHYGHPDNGKLPTQLANPPSDRFLDVNCDSFATPIDALLVINHINRNDGSSGNSGSGIYPDLACSPELAEGSDFVSELTREMTLPNDSSAIRIHFRAPEFDVSSRQTIRDAFEIEVTDAHGVPVSFPFMPGQEAVYNWSENLDPKFGAGTTTTTQLGDADSTATVNLSGLPAGSPIRVTARLVNNDLDDATRVILRGFEVIDASEVAPIGASGAAGRTPQLAPIDMNELTDITGRIRPNYGHSTLRGDNDQLTTELMVTNLGTQTVSGQIIVAIDNISSLEAAALHPDGFLRDGRPFWDLTHEMDNQPLVPGASIRSRQIGFQNSGDSRFTYRLSAYGKLNAAPDGFSSVPLTSIEAGKPYTYQAHATDPDAQELRYSKVVGPESMHVDPNSGKVTWDTTESDIGSHQVVLRATDPYGLFVQQEYSLAVLATLQNRPPVFVTDPVTNAIASSGFEISTVGVGGSPAGVAVVRGIRGPRLVTANSADQTIGVYAGENNDRFDDATTYSTGLPQADGQLLDIGYSVDVGLPTFVNNGDDNNVTGLAQGDFNGDGAIDLAVTYNFDQAGDLSIGTSRTVVVLNHGDGTFGVPTTLYEREIYDYQTLVRALSVADLNADGHSDVIFAEQHAEGRLMVALGNGDGSFQPTTETAYDDHVIGDFKIADIDGDGVLDLFGRTVISVAFGSGSRGMFWSKGVGDGTFGVPNEFRETRTSGLRETATPYDLADLDGDGDLDYAISGDNQLLQVFHNDGAGNFSLVNEFDPPSAQAFYDPDWLVVADFTGDGHHDILYQHVWQGRLNLLVGDGSGVDFVHQEGTEYSGRPDNWATDHEPFDLDGDGDLDLVLTHETGSQIAPKVALNNGDGTFEISEYPMVDFSGSILPLESGDIARGALVADYNGDGVLDFSYFTDGNDFNGVGIRLGTRPGEFGNTRTVPWVQNSRFEAALAGDFDGDGIVDLIDTVNDRTFLGNGDGTFAEPFPSLGQSGTYAAAGTADFNLDGLTDFVAQGGLGYKVGLSNGDGTFTLSDNQRIANSFYGIDSLSVHDFNQDGYQDFISKAGVEQHIDVHLNDPENPGVFEVAFRHTLDGGSQGTNVSHWDSAWDVGDYTGDGILDLIFAERGTESTSVIEVVVMAGDGAGNFVPHSRLAGFGESEQVNIYGSRVEPGDFVTGDIDEDGDLDLLSASYLGTRVFLNDGTGRFAFRELLESTGTSQRAQETWLVDFDQDGHLDLFQTGQHGAGPLTIWLGDGRGQFEIYERTDVIASVPAVRDPFIDVDGDGHLDLVYATGGHGNYGSDDAAIYAGRRDDLVDILTVDLNGDGNEEVLAVQEQMDRLQIFAGDNLGGLTRKSDLLTGRAPQAVAATDLDGNGVHELLVVNRASRSLSLFVGDLASGYASSEIAVGVGPVDVASSDLNEDGNQDLVVLDDVANALWIFNGHGSTLLENPTSIALGDRPGRFVLEDATGDGIVDAVVTLPESSRLMILPGDGAGEFGSPFYITLGSRPSDIAVLDLNDDGHPDLAATIATTGSLSIHYGLGNNQFARAQEVSVGKSPNRIVVSDADDDGRLDLIVSNEGDNTVSVVYNRFDPNEVYRYDSDAIDPDGDSLTYSIENGPGGLIINSTTGELLWAASPDQVGVHDVTIAADDGRAGIATQSFKIEVEPARENSAPIIATTPSTSIGANESFTYTVEALDKENDAGRFRLLEGPEGATLDPVTGELTWDGRSKALLFGANNQAGDIRLPSNESLRPSSLTIEGWFNNHSLTASGGAAYLFTQTNDYGVAYTLSFHFNNEIRLLMQYDGDFVQLRLPFNVETDRWYHIALTIDDADKEATVWVDGESLGSTSIPASIDYTTSRARPLEVGHRGQFFTRATLDNFRMWNVARSQVEIREGMSRNYDGNPQLVLDYRFEDSNARSVRDSTMHENIGYRTGNPLAPQTAVGLATTGQYEFRVAIEDGRGGYDEQSFTLDVVPELRGSIRGHLFDDLNGDGEQDDGSAAGVPAEPNLEGWHLWIDSNGNAYPDPHEAQATTDVDGNYEFPGLLPGSYPVRVSPVAGYAAPGEFDATVEPEIKRELDSSGVMNYDLAIEQLSLSQLRGQLQTKVGDAIAYWKAYADLDGNGQLDENEPMATSDRNGNYALTGLAAGTYTIRADQPAGWADSAGRDGLQVTLAADEVSHGNDFTLEPTNSSAAGGVHFVTQPGTEVEARQTFSYASAAMGILNEAILYDLPLAPEGMVVDPDTGLVAWRPTIGQVGEHLVILRATNASGSISLHDFNLDVTAPNTPPVILSPVVSAESSQQEANGGQHDVSAWPASAYVDYSYLVDIVAQDAESTELSFALTQAPSGATIDPNTGRIRWIPAVGDVGEHDFSVQVQDQAGATASTTWTVNVENSVPVVLPLEISYPRTTAAVTADYFSRISARDTIGRPVTWSLTSGPAGLTIASNGTIQWTPGTNQLGSQTVELVATLADAQTQNVNFEIEVAGRLLNSSPVIESEPVTSVSLGRTFEYHPIVKDAEQDVHAFTLLEGPTGMSVHSSLGYVRWTPATDQLGEHHVRLQVSDPSGDTLEQSFTLTVSRFGGPPRIVSIPPTEAAIGSAFLYSVEAVDREGDPLSYTLLVAPDGMTIVETTGELSWTPSAAQVGQQDVVIQVSDGIGGAVTQAFVVKVSAGDVNLPPEIISSSPRFGAVGTEYRYQLIAVDPEDTSITYTLGRGPTGMTVDETTGQVNWTPMAGDEGKHVVTLLATDAGGASAVESFEFDVLAQNTRPMINSVAPVESTAGAFFVYEVLASDADLDALTFELTEAPVGAEIDVFGRLHWQTELGNIGAYDFAIRVTDPRGGEAMQSFQLELVEDSEGPKVSLIESPNDANRNVLPWQGPFVVYAKAIDNVEVASLTLSANGQDIPLDAAGTATFTFEDWSFATIHATATAIDTSGNVSTRTITFNYDFPEGWGPQGSQDVPLAEITSPTEAQAVFGMVSIHGTAAHDDFALYKLSYRHVDETTYTEFHRSDIPVTNGELGVWDTSLLLNDEYFIRLEVATNAGVVNVAEHNIGLSGELKLGNFQLSFTDMVIPVAGIPLEITRIYDTLHANRQGDFGLGWRLEFRNTDLRVGLPASGLEDIGVYAALRAGVKVYLNVPGEGRQGFTFDPDIRVLPGWGGNNLVLARPRFRPDPGVTSTLSTGTSGYLQVNDRGELFAPGAIPYNPASPDFGGAYTLTTRAGVIYRIDGSSGKLASAADRNGNRVIFDDQGVRLEGSDATIRFERDTAGRITSVTDLAGNAVRYEYGFNGLLEAVSDRELNRTEFIYHSEPHHFLERVLDPLGRTGNRTEYDDQGRLIRMLDAGGTSVQFAVDVDSELVTVTNQLGHDTTYVYDSRGNITQSIDSLGGITTSEYDATNSLVSTVDAMGNRTSFINDRNGNVLASTDANGNVSRFTYSPQSQLLSMTDSLGSTTHFEYDQAGNQTRLIDPLGATRSQTYNSKGNVTEIVEANGARIEFLYNSEELAGVVDQTGTTTVFERDSNGQFTSETTEIETLLGKVVQRSAYVYDRNERMVGLENSKGAVSGLTLDAAGQIVGASTVAGSNQQIGYDSRGFQNSFASNENQVTTINDALGRPIETSIENGLSFVNEYDALGRLVKQIDSDGATSTQEYDLLGRVIRRTNSQGETIEFAYDAVGNLVEERFLPTNTVTNYQYDAAGRLIGQSTDGIGYVSTLDDAGRTVGVEYSNGQVEEYAYDSVGNLVAWKTREGLHWQYKYNEVGQVNEIIDGLGNRTTMGFDSSGSVDSISDALGRTTRIAYNSVGQIAHKQLPLGQTANFTFDDAGVPIRRESFGGGVLKTQYDSLGRLSEIRDGDDRLLVERIYQSDGGLIINTLFGTNEISVNSVGNAVTWKSVNGLTTENHFDDHQRLIGFGSGANAVSFEDNALGRRSAIARNGTDIVTLQYDNLGGLIEIDYGDGNSKTQINDPQGRVQQIAYSADGSAILQDQYTYDNFGRIVQLARLSGESTTYSYNALGQLVESSTTKDNQLLQQVAYQYDASGNMVASEFGGTTEIREYDANDRILSDGTYSYMFDDEGNLVRRVSSSGTDVFEYDAFQRLITFRRTGDTEITIEYRYDSDGLIASRTVNGVRENYTWDRNSDVQPFLYEVFSASGTLVRRYLNDGLRYLAVEDSSGIRMLLTDIRGSIVGVQESSGQVTEISLNDFGEYTSPNPLEIGFAGGFYDGISNLTYFASRWYDGHNGRFTQTDDAASSELDSRSINRYVYSLSDPINRIDPLGQFSGSLIEQLQTFKVQATIAAIGAAVIGSGAGEFLLKKLTRGAVNFDPNNLTGSTRPFLELSRGASNNNSRSSKFKPIGFSSSLGYGLAIGFEHLLLNGGADNSQSNQGSIYFYVGGNVGASVSGSASSAGGKNGSSDGSQVGIAFRGAVGEVFDTPTYEDYTGMFVNLTGGLTFTLSVGKEITSRFGSSNQLAFGAGRIRSISWSPLPGSTGVFSHTRTDFKAGGGSSVSANGKKGIAVGAALKASMGVSYYFRLIDF